MYRDEENGERGYPWFFFYTGKPWVKSTLLSLLIVIVATLFYLWYNSISDDRSPDSLAGYLYAFAGTLCLILAATRYTLLRRARNRAVGQLHSSLNWHMCFGLLGIVLLFMHSFGNFNARSGTYALYGLIALVISGLVGRLLDHLVPRLMAAEVSKALTAQGEDRIEAISRRLQAIVTHNTQDIRSFQAKEALSMPGMSHQIIESERFIKKDGKNAQLHSLTRSKPGDEQSLQTPWDLAYISLDETPQEVRRDPQHYRFVPDRKSSFERPGTLLPGAKEHMKELEHAQQALQREQFLRYILRYWRIFHISLVFVTVGLTVWHITYALQLLIPVWLQR